MARPEDIRTGAAVKGIPPGQTVQAETVEPAGGQEMKAAVRDPAGTTAEVTLSRDGQDRLGVQTNARPLNWITNFIWGIADDALRD